MLDQFITYEEYAPIEDLIILYINVTLLKPIGKYPIGTFFESIQMNYDNGRFTITKNDREMDCINFELKVKE